DSAIRHFCLSLVLGAGYKIQIISSLQILNIYLSPTQRMYRWRKYQTIRGTNLGHIGKQL
ncbi:hypothetical protein, partial [Brucella oryzae]|uniref:hypothetical protein n=1 Tax=Brucella oryzae TaxID=335286 RepID=UPI001ABFEAB2